MENSTKRLTAKTQFLLLHFLRSCQRYATAALILFATALVLTICSSALNPVVVADRPSAALIWIGLLGLLALSALDAYWLFSAQATTIALVQAWGGNAAIFLGLPTICLCFLGTIAGIAAGAATGILPFCWTALAFSSLIGFLLAACSSLPMLWLVVFRSTATVLREKV